MFHYKSIYLCLILMLFFSCSRKKAIQVDNRVIPVVLEEMEYPEATRPPPIKPLPPVAIQIASLQQTGCYGNCPIYEYRVFNDGRVTYIGRKHVQKMGIYEAHLSKDLVDQIIAYASLIGFFEMPDRFPSSGQDIIDLPSRIVFVKKETVEKTILNRFDAPKGLNDYEAYFLGVMNSLNWERVNAQQ